MSWKSFVSAGLLCILATPVFAQGPTLRITSGGLNPQGNWVWNVSIEETYTAGDGLSPVAAELGFETNRDVVSVTLGAEFDGANTLNPGTVIFGWEDLTALGGTGSCDSASPGNCPVGLLWHSNDASAPLNQIFAAIGSKTDNGFSGEQGFLTIVTTGPTSTSLTGSVEVLGAYGADSGRIAQLTGPDAAANYQGYAGTASRTLKTGDINLNGFTDGDDFTTFLSQYQPGVGGKVGGWSIGDFNRNGFVDGDDFTIFIGGYQPGVPGGSSTPLTVSGTAGGAGGAVPEPASIAMGGLALLAGLGFTRRR